MLLASFEQTIGYHWIKKSQVKSNKLKPYSMPIQIKAPSLMIKIGLEI